MAGAKLTDWHRQIAAGIAAAHPLTAVLPIRAKELDTKSLEYGVWKSIRHRCATPTHRLFPKYGGRGIKVCHRWDQSFAAFLADMGPRPAGANTLARLDEDGDYELANCEWAHRKSKNDQRRSANPVTAERVLHMFDYDAATGVFTRKDGSSIGHTDSNGYIQIRIDGRGYRAHRLAWLVVHGQWPLGEIDHINRVKTDNRLANLRDVGRCGNMQNADTGPKSRTGVRGVAHHPATGKFAAYISRNRKKHWLGVHDTIEQATAARRQAEEEIA